MTDIGDTKNFETAVAPGSTDTFSPGESGIWIISFMSVHNDSGDAVNSFGTWLPHMEPDSDGDGIESDEQNVPLIGGVPHRGGSSTRRFLFSNDNVVGISNIANDDVTFTIQATKIDPDEWNIQRVEFNTEEVASITPPTDDRYRIIFCGGISNDGDSACDNIYINTSTLPDSSSDGLHTDDENVAVIGGVTQDDGLGSVDGVVYSNDNPLHVGFDHPTDGEVIIHSKKVL